MPQESHAIQPKLALGELRIQLFLLKSLQHKPEVTLMLIFTSWVHKDIVDEHHYELIETILEHLIHLAHKYH